MFLLEQKSAKQSCTVLQESLLHHLAWNINRAGLTPAVYGARKAASLVPFCKGDPEISIQTQKYMHRLQPQQRAAVWRGCTEAPMEWKHLVVRDGTSPSPLWFNLDGPHGAASQPRGVLPRSIGVTWKTFQPHRKRLVNYSAMARV